MKALSVLLLESQNGNQFDSWSVSRFINGLEKFINNEHATESDFNEIKRGIIPDYEDQILNIQQFLSPSASLVISDKKLVSGELRQIQDFVKKVFAMWPQWYAVKKEYQAIEKLCDDLRRRQDDADDDEYEHKNKTYNNSNKLVKV